MSVMILHPSELYEYDLQYGNKYHSVAAKREQTETVLALQGSEQSNVTHAAERS